mgnify:CR=1 FL=1
MVNVHVFVCSILITFFMMVITLTRGRDVKLPEAFQSSKHCFSWVVFGGMYLSDYLLDSQKIGTYLILFCLTQMINRFKIFWRAVWGVKSGETVSDITVWHFFASRVQKTISFTQHHRNRLTHVKSRQMRYSKRTKEGIFEKSLWKKTIVSDCLTGQISTKSTYGRY